MANILTARRQAWLNDSLQPVCEAEYFLPAYFVGLKAVSTELPAVTYL
jgi:hypothetical protein